MEIRNLQTAGRRDTGGRVRVLGVDDRPEVCEALRVRLTLGGFEWLGCLPDAERLLSEARALRPDLIILDLDMPGPDPLAVLKDVTRECPGVRTIIYTGLPDLKGLDEAFDAGAWGYVEKSADVGALIDAMHDVLSERVVVLPDGHLRQRPPGDRRAQS